MNHDNLNYGHPPQYQQYTASSLNQQSQYHQFYRQYSQQQQHVQNYYNTYRQRHMRMFQSFSNEFPGLQHHAQFQYPQWPTSQNAPKELQRERPMWFPVKQVSRESTVIQSTVQFQNTVVSSDTVGTVPSRRVESDLNNRNSKNPTTVKRREPSKRKMRDTVVVDSPKRFSGYPSSESEVTVAETDFSWQRGTVPLLRPLLDAPKDPRNTVSGALLEAPRGTVASSQTSEEEPRITVAPPGPPMKTKIVYVFSEVGWQRVEVPDERANRMVEDKKSTVEASEVAMYNSKARITVESSGASRDTVVEPRAHLEPEGTSGTSESLPKPSQPSGASSQFPMGPRNTVVEPENHRITVSPSESEDIESPMDTFDQNDTTRITVPQPEIVNLENELPVEIIDLTDEEDDWEDSEGREFVSQFFQV